MASLNHTLTLQNICDTVFKSNAAVIDSFATFLKAKVEIEDFDSYIDEFKEALHKSTFTFYGETIDEKTEKKTKKKVAIKTKILANGEKKEKNPSIYNLFVSDHIKNMQKNTGTMGRGDHMKIISNLWNNSDEGHFFAKRAQEIKKENTTLINAEIYDIVKKEWTEGQVEESEEEEVDTTIPLPPTEKTVKPKASTSKKDMITKPKKEEPKKVVAKPVKAKSIKSTKVTKAEEEEDSPATKAYIREKMETNSDDESNTSVEEEPQTHTDPEIKPIVEDDEDEDEEEPEVTVEEMFGEDGDVTFDEE